MIRKAMPLSLVAFVSLHTAAPAQPAPDAGARAAAQELVRLTNLRGQMQRTMDATMAQMRSGAAFTRVLEANPGFRMARSKNPRKFEEVFKRVGAIQAEVASRVLVEMAPEVERLAVDSYARRFSAAELRGLSAFYRTPLGGKLLREQPGIMADSVTLVQRRLAPRMAQEMQAAAPRIQAELKRLAPPPGTAPKTN